MIDLRAFFTNTLLAAFSCLVLLAILEFVVFRFVFVASNLPELAAQSTPGPLHYKPNQIGNYRLRNEINARFKINKNGWNSGLEEYQVVEERKNLVVVIGDSYVEALQVDASESFAELLYEKISKETSGVYRFGLSGAPLSQYLYMLREIVPKYKPSIAIVNLVHNDFSESLLQGSGTYGASFARVVFDDDGSLGLTEPVLYQRSATAWIKKSAIFRYLWVRQQIRPQKIKQLWNLAFQKRAPTVEHVANVNIADLDRATQIEEMMDYIFGEFAELRKNYGVEFLLVLDGNRSAIVDSVEMGSPYENKLDWLHALVEKTASKKNLPLVDLTDMFHADYSIHRRAFSFENDGHWNSYAHGLVAEELANEIATRWPR